MNEEALTDEKIDIEEANGADMEKRVSEEEAADTKAQSDESSTESVSLELQDVAKDYLDPSLMNGIRIVESSELFDVEEGETPVSDDEMDKYIETFSDIAQNQVITGRVIGQNEKEIIMDIGFKSEGIIPRSEFSDAEPPNMGETIEVYLEKIEDKNGQTVLSNLLRSDLPVHSLS